MNTINLTATTFQATPEAISLQYHRTIVATYKPALKELTLNTGGYSTSTTKRRMNSFLDYLRQQGFTSRSLYIQQTNYRWHLKECIEHYSSISGTPMIEHHTIKELKQTLTLTI